MKRFAYVSFLLALLVFPLRPSVAAEEAPVEREIPELPTPTGATALDAPVDRREYLVGPGDGFALSLWGEVNTTVSLTVTPEGDLILPVGGNVRVAGTSISTAEERVRRRLDDYYHDTELTLSLTEPRQVLVHVTGAVTSPGEYAATAAMRVSTVIGLAGGILEHGSQRNIAVAAFDGSTRRADLVRYRHRGELNANPLVMEGSMIRVPFEQEVVSVLGAVNRPGLYEVVAGDELVDMLDIAGGPRPDANLADVEIVRFSEDDPTVYTSFGVDLSDAWGGGARASMALEDGDCVLVRQIERWHRDARVEISGEVAFPGLYSIVEGRDRLSDVVEHAGGLAGAADLARATLRRTAAAEIEDGATRQVELLETFERDQMSYEEYAFLLSQRLELGDQVSVDFEALFIDEDESADALLLDGDLIEIPRALSVVRVSGAVRRPGLVAFRSGARFGDYVKLAGGYTSDAQRRGLRIMKAQSGSRLRPSRRVRIEPGDIVWVPRRKDRDWWEITKEILSVAGQVATIAIIIDGLNK
jgi:protein involved in polysaccharide export with SLBB domain